MGLRPKLTFRIDAPQHVPGHLVEGTLDYPVAYDLVDRAGATTEATVRFRVQPDGVVVPDNAALRQQIPDGAVRNWVRDEIKRALLARVGHTQAQE